MPRLRLPVLLLPGHLGICRLVGCGRGPELCPGKGEGYGNPIYLGRVFVSVGRKSRVVGQGTWVLVLVAKF